MNLNFLKNKKFKSLLTQVEKMQRDFPNSSEQELIISKAHKGHQKGCYDMYDAKAQQSKKWYSNETIKKR